MSNLTDVKAQHDRVTFTIQLATRRARVTSLSLPRSEARPEPDVHSFAMDLRLDRPQTHRQGLCVGMLISVPIMVNGIPQLFKE